MKKQGVQCTIYSPRLVASHTVTYGVNSVIRQVAVVRGIIWPSEVILDRNIMHGPTTIVNPSCKFHDDTYNRFL